MQFFSLPVFEAHKYDTKVQYPLIKSNHPSETFNSFIACVDKAFPDGGSSI